jgi:hypothetical protein
MGIPEEAEGVQAGLATVPEREGCADHAIESGRRAGQGCLQNGCEGLRWAAMGYVAQGGTARGWTTRGNEL